MVKIDKNSIMRSLFAAHFNSELSAFEAEGDAIERIMDKVEVGSESDEQLSIHIDLMKSWSSRYQNFKERFYKSLDYLKDNYC